MDVRTYAATFRQFACFLSPGPGMGPLTRVAAGANGGDVAWTEGMMSLCKKQGLGGRVRFAMEALSVHIYCSVRLEGVTGREEDSAAQEAGWFLLAQKANAFREALRMHVAVMDRHDPDRLVALFVDEWGVWYAEPTKPLTSSPQQSGTAPAGALLEQACTLRDALVAAVCLHAMIDACDRVKLANLAQAVNVLHAPLRTVAGMELVHTPTFHALALLNRHMGCKRLQAQLSHALLFNHGPSAVPRLSFAVSMDGTSQAVHLSITHLHPHAPVMLEIDLRGFDTTLRVEHALVLTGPTLNASTCKPVALDAASARMTSANLLCLHVPPRSLLAIDLVRG